jgi:hypothetical protein
MIGMMVWWEDRNTGQRELEVKGIGASEVMEIEIGRIRGNGNRD